MAIEDKARAQRIATLRKQKRLTQEVMAQKLDVAYRTYQTWESMKEPVMPDWPNLEKLARFHGVKAEDIIGEAPDISALMGNGQQSQLDRIEQKLDLILDGMGLSPSAAADAAEVAARATEQRKAASGRRQGATPTKRRSG